MVIQLFRVWNKRKASVYSENGIHPARQFMQIIVWMFRGFSALEYYIYPLYVIDPRPVIRHREYDLLQKKLNPIMRGVIPVDKWIQSLIWKATGISHAQVFGFIKDGKGHLGDNLYTGLESELRSFISNQQLPIIIKPVDGCNGVGFDIIEKFDDNVDQLQTKSIGVISLYDFSHKVLTEPGGILFQVKIVQHAELTDIFPNAVNTVRVITHLGSDGKCSVLQAMMKFGGGSNIIDNDVEEGLLAMVDIESGKMDVAMQRFGYKRFTKHPDTGVAIQGVTVPYWAEAMALTIKAHQVIPYPRHLGWDVAITDEGPKILEMNAYLSIAVSQKINNYSSMKLQDL